MNPFLYRLNGLKKPEELFHGGKFKQDVLARFHLGHLDGELVNQSDADVAFCEVDGEYFALLVMKVPPNGNTATHTSFDARKEPDRNTQRWYKHPDGSIEIGWVIDSIPGPEVLARPNAAGLRTADASGREWLVPIGRSTKNGRETFIRDFVFDLAENSVQQVRSASSDQLFDIAAEIWDLYINDDKNSMTDQQWHRLFELVVEALGINYCISSLEVNAFQAMGKPIFDTTVVDVFAMAVTDFEIYEEFKKKEMEEKESEAGVISS